MLASRKSDQHQFSPNSIIKRKVYENEWSLRENALIFEQILSTNSVRKCMEISLENLYVDSGA